MNNISENIQFGFINAYDAFKGYGFIRRKKGKDVFFLFDQLPKGDYEPCQGDQVSFQIEKRTKGPRAIQIKIIGRIDKSIGVLKN